MANPHDVTTLPPAVAKRLSGRVGDGREAIAVGSRSGLIEWTNQAWTRITGWPLEHSINKPVTRLLDEVGVEREVIDFIQSNYLAGRRSAVELPVETPTGRSIWLHLEVEPCRDETGEISDFVAVAQDITERRHTEQTSGRLAEGDVGSRSDNAPPAESLDPGALSLGLEAVRIGRLLAPVIEEIDSLVGPVPDESSSARLSELVHRARGLTAQLVGVGDPAGPTPCEVDVSELVRACVNAIRQELSRCTQLDCVLPPLPPLVRVDAGGLFGILTDLMQAAADELDGSWGTISLTTGTTRPGHALRSEVYHRSYLPTLRDSQPRVFIELHDTAVNLPPADLRRLGEGLCALPVPAPGRMFTLLRAQALLAAQGGELDVNSAPGCGTRVLILLPVAEQ